MKVLYAASEAAPLVKTGGLGDVASALPPALQRRGIDVRMVIPAYPSALQNEITASWRLESLPGYPPARLLEALWPNGVSTFLVDSPRLYERGGGPYQDTENRDWPDNAERFALLCHAAVELARHNWRPDIIHCNDWQTGLIPAYLEARGIANISTVFTIHNLAYQGVFPAATFSKLDLPSSMFNVAGIEFHGQLSFLKAGIYYADQLTTVSPTYAREIQTRAGGCGLHGLLQARADDVTGIVNGIDAHVWNPATDQLIALRYSESSLEAKAVNKAELQRENDLPVLADVPLFGVVSRLTSQKGLDLVLKIAPALTEIPAQLVVLGDGDPDLVESFLKLARMHAEKISVSARFDEAAAHQIFAGADIFLMPSRFEPCGLSQMYSQRYGTLPIVHAAGGLIDTVEDYSDGAESATGFIFQRPTATDFMAAVRKAVRVYRDRSSWRLLQQNAMRKDFGWEKSARAYQSIYRQLHTQTRV